MPQLGILFDAQKLGSGFYGYTAFRILFSVIPPRDLGGANLYHGEIGEGRVRPYCIAVESDNPLMIARVRQLFAASVARGLMPAQERFVEDYALGDEVLALAAHVTPQGELKDCQSRWLNEAWQRAAGQGNAATNQAAAHAPAPPKTPEAKLPIRLPSKVPLMLRWSPGVRTTIALLFACALGGALVPWFGWPFAICAMIFLSGAIQGLLLRLRLFAEENLSGSEIVNEAIRALQTKEALERLSSAGCLASPLLRRAVTSLRATHAGADLSGACLAADQHSGADRAAWSADLREITNATWAIPAAAALSVAVLGAVAGQQTAMLEGARIAPMAITGWLLLQWLAGLLANASDRNEAQVRRLFASHWMPALAKSSPTSRTLFPTLENALNELTKQLETMQGVMERRRDVEFVDTMTGLRASIDQLTPVLAGFREPFVLQAVPAAAPRPKAMSASA